MTLQELATTNYNINKAIYDPNEVYKSFYNGYEVEAGNIFVKMFLNGSEPTLARKSDINQLVLDLKGLGTEGADNVFQLLDSVQPYRADDQIQSLVDFRQPFKILPTVYNNSIFTPNRDYRNTGIDTGYQPVIHGINYTQNSASIGTYVTLGGQQYQLGIEENPTRAWVRTDNPDGTIDGALNGGVVQVPGGAEGDYVNHFITHTRSNGNEIKTWQDDILQGTTASASNGVPSTYTFMYLGINRVAPSTGFGRGSMFYAGGDLSSYMTQLIGSFQKYLTATL
jgi:hypothetical protein